MAQQSNLSFCTIDHQSPNYRFREKHTQPSPYINAKCTNVAVEQKCLWQEKWKHSFNFLNGLFNKWSCFVSPNIMTAVYAGALSGLRFWRISVKALQDKLLRLELRTRLFINGCLRGSLEKDHSFSNLNAPWRPMLVCSLQRRHLFFFFKAALHLLPHSQTSKGSTSRHHYLKCSLANSLMLTGMITSSPSLELRITDWFFWFELSSSWLVRDSCYHNPL